RTVKGQRRKSLCGGQTAPDVWTLVTVVRPGTRPTIGTAPAEPTGRAVTRGVSIMAEPFDVIEALVRDHRLLNELLERLDDDDQSAEMHALFLRIAEELAAHEAAER